MEYLTLENILIFVAALEAFIGALPNNWVKYRSFILRLLKAIEEF